METIKAFSDIEQSKKLVEILPLESADMYYEAIYRLDKPEEILEYTPRPIIGSILKAIEHRNLMRSITLETKTYKMKDIGIPCWSLAALLDALPVIIGDVLSENALRLRMDKSETEFTVWYENLDSGMVEEGLDIIKSSPVDACYEMIEKLHELKML